MVFLLLQLLPPVVDLSQPAMPADAYLDVVEDVIVVPEVIEESGPVEYVDEEEEDYDDDHDDGGLGDEEMDELAYEGDPLLHSDYEDGKFMSLACVRLREVIMLRMWCMYFLPCRWI